MIALLANDPVVTDSLRHWQEKRPMPTALGSGELRELGREVHLRSVFSARTTNADYLEDVAEVVDDMLSGKINLATGRLRLMRRLAELGYDPATGFPGEVAAIPPAERDSLQDLSSQARLDLMLKTNVALARNYGRVLAGNTPSALFAAPAWELVRLGWRHVPRGTPQSHTEGWQRRWIAAGESVSWSGVLPAADDGTRAAGSRPSMLSMIALKDSPIWQALGDGEGGDWSDTLGHPYPPFAFNSGMDWRAVPRAECASLGLLGVRENESPAPMKAQLSPGDQEIADAINRLSPELRAMLNARSAE